MYTTVATNETIHDLVSKALMDGLTDFLKSKKKVDLNHIDVSGVTDMSYLFCGCHIEADIGQWDVSNVTTMKGMFQNSVAQPDLSNWNVANVENMQLLFAGATFHGDISRWSINSKCSVVNSITAYALMSNKNVGELHYLVFADYCNRVEGVEQYLELHPDHVDNFAKYTNAARDIHAAVGSNLYGVELGRLAWEMYKNDTRGTNIVDTIELPQDFSVDFDFAM